MDYGAPLHCQNCGTLNSPRANLTGVPACASCGLTSVEGAFAMQDELSKLFERGMTFAQPQLPTAAQHQQQQSQQQQSPSPEVRPVLGYSASQHYIPVTRPVLSPEPEAEPDSERLPLAVEQVLWQHGISPDSLSKAQKALFLYATPDQRARLLDLWAYTYDQTQDRQSDMDASMEQNPYRPLTHDGQESAEPYIQNGYDMQDQASSSKGNFSPFGSAVGNKEEYRQAVDPAFQHTSLEWWRHGHEAHSEPIEHQYGMFAAMRDYHIPIDDDEML